MEKINNVVKSPIAPKTTNAIWINTEDNTINVFNEHQGWTKIGGGGDGAPWKPDIVLAINEVGGYADESMTIGQLANAIRNLNLVQLGELEYNIPIENAEEAINLASSHCTKYVNDYTTRMYTPLIVDEWQAVEEVRYKKLQNYNFMLFSSDERKIGVYALTNCHELKRVIFDVLKTISLPDSSSCIGQNLQMLELLSLPELESIYNVYNGANDTSIFSELDRLTTLDLSKLKSINVQGGAGGTVSTSNIFSDLNSLGTLYAPMLENITLGGNTLNRMQLFSGLINCKSIILPSLKSANIVSRSSSENGYFCSDCVNLEYIEIGHTNTEGGSIVNNMRINIDPTNIYKDATKLAALNASIRDHWFANLRDYTGVTAHTLTLPAALVQHMEEATKQVATDKNWTIVTF